ncbi:MAG: hypothetical protein RBR35_16955 [Salinivirgaceae bacterium]|nr:hypothetical protein [Salinivirgaceae bacterium]
MPISKCSGVKLSAAEKRATALELRKSGLTLQQIADNLNCSKGYAHKLVMDSLHELITQSETLAEELRELENMRLDALWEASYEKAKAGDLSAINTCIRISERRAKLFGLDGTQKVEHSGGVAISLQLADCSKKEDECNITPVTRSSLKHLPGPNE